MEGKPLSKERRKAIDKILGFWDCACTDDKNASPCLRCQFQEVADAELFWREAVKNATSRSYVEYDCDYSACPFCEEKAFCNTDSIAEHKPDCPWVLAQKC